MTIEEIQEPEITCPYCGWIDGDSWESNLDNDGDEEVIECPECHKKFAVTMNVVVSYNSHGLCKENGVEHDWKEYDFISKKNNKRHKGKKCLTYNKYVIDDGETVNKK